MAEQSSVNCQVHAWPRTACTVCTVWFNVLYPNHDRQNCLTWRDTGISRVARSHNNRRHIFWTSKIFNGRMGHSKWLTAALQDTQATGVTGESWRVHVHRLAQTQTFHCPCSMLVGYGAVGNFHRSQSVAREGEAVSPNLYRCALRHSASFNILLSDCKKNAFEKQGMLWSSVF